MSTCLSCLMLLLSSAGLSVTSSPFPDITDQTFIDECVEEHNRGRSSVSPPASGMRYMTWDEGLAVTARSWAKFCVFEHNENRRQKGKGHPVFTSVGENLWVGAPYSAFSAKSAIESWIKESEYYNYESLQCSKVCGHYTQVVWANTYKVGCAVQACPNGVASFSTSPGAIFVCNYATAGNYAGSSPYQKGRACSKCGNEICEKNLCRNSTRDALRRYYNWTPDWDKDLLTCGPFCKTLLIFRPVSVLFIFCSVYGLQIRYPNLFAYTT